MNCWQCGHEIRLLTAQKINTRDTCPQCDADLHCCRACRHFDAQARGECREVMAEPVRSKDRNNYCDYFSPLPSALSSAPPASPSASSKQSAMDQFDQLFKKR